MSYKGKKNHIEEVTSEEGYDRYASFYKKDEAYLNTFDQKMLLRAIRDLSGKEILDVGVGTGRHAWLWKKRGGEHVTGIDISEEMLERARGTGVFKELIQADIREELPFDWDHFDVILCSLVLVHLRDREIPQLLEEFHRILRPGGKVYLVNIPQRRAPKLEDAAGDPFFISSYQHSDKTLLAEMKAAGFHNIKKLDQEEQGEHIASLIVGNK